MADPQPYNVSYNFSSFQANNPTTPLPAPKVDNEFANIAAAVADLVAAIKDVRRSDGALNNGLVDFDQLAPALQLTFDPTNGQLVAAAVAVAQASATAAAGSSTSAGVNATAAAASAAAAATSAGTVNLSLYLAKANNLANMGSNDTALANIGAMKVDGSTAVGRLAGAASGLPITDWNAALTSGWYSGANALNGPPASAGGAWLVEVIAYDTTYVTQIAYPFTSAINGTTAVTPYRRHSFNNGGVASWQPWEGMSPVPVGSTIWVNGTTAPPGFTKENGSLLLRASFPALWAYALGSGNIGSESQWTSGVCGFSTGDLSTTFRVPDTRGEFIRAWDDSAGVDSGRAIGSLQADALKSHTHPFSAADDTGPTSDITAGSVHGAVVGSKTTGTPSTGAATETRPRNTAKLACIKY